MVFHCSRLFLKIQTGISEELLKSVTQQIRVGMISKVAFSVDVFREPCQIVENDMKHGMYPNFLGSETYLIFVQIIKEDFWYVNRL